MAARLHRHALLKESDLAPGERVFTVIGRWSALDMEEWDVIATSAFKACKHVKLHELHGYDNPDEVKLVARLVW